MANVQEHELALHRLCSTTERHRGGLRWLRKRDRAGLARDESVYAGSSTKGLQSQSQS